MKQGNFIVKIVMWVFFAGILAYFSMYAYHVLFRSYETAALYTYNAEEVVEANAYLFRQETVLSGASELEEIVAGEGETVGVGDTLAVRYADQEALNRSVEQRALESRLESLEYILTHATDGADSVTLNQSIVDSITKSRIMAASGDLTELDELSGELKNLMFRRDYTYNGSTALSEEIAQISNEIKSLKKQNKESAKKIKAEVSGVFSGVVDGYEGIMTPEAAEHLSVSGLRELAMQEKAASNKTLGKIITGSTWYCAAEVDSTRAEKLYEGAYVEVRFNGFDWTLNMKVESVSKEEHGVVCVVLSSDRYLANITALRNQSIDLIFSTASGYRVPKSAIYVDSTNAHPGIYRLYGSQAEWVDVDLLWEGEDYYLVRQSPELDEEGNEVELTALQKAKRLRAGSEIIVLGRDLYDGKVME